MTGHVAWDYGEMGDDAFDEMRQTPEGWAFEQEMEVAAEVYGPQPQSLRKGTDWSELSDEDIVERYQRMLGFDLRWDNT